MPNGILCCFHADWSSPFEVLYKYDKSQEKIHKVAVHVDSCECGACLKC